MQRSRQMLAEVSGWFKSVMRPSGKGMGIDQGGGCDVEVVRNRRRCRS